MIIFLITALFALSAAFILKTETPYLVVKLRRAFAETELFYAITAGNTVISKCCKIYLSFLLFALFL